MTSRHWVKHLAAVLLSAVVPALAASSDNQSDAFYAAIRTNDLARVEGLLKQGASANTKDDRGITALMYAAAAGSADAMKLLIDKGADVNAKNAFGSTALMWSATDLKKVRLLVERGADVNAASKQGRTALIVAALSDNSAEIVRFLIAKGAGVKPVDGLKTTALIAATSGNDTETIRMLVDAGLDVNAADMGGFTPLMNAASTGNLAAVRILLAKRANVNAVSAGAFQTVKNGNIALGKFTPLLLASAFGPADLVRALLDAGADINAKDVRGMTPLMLAVATDRQDPEVIRALLAKGADLQVTSLAGETALDWAQKTGPPFAVDALQNAGAKGAMVKAIPVGTSSPVELKPAVERGIHLLEKASAEFFVAGGCASCHHQNITDIAVSVARTKGVHVDEKAAVDRQRLYKAFFGSAGPMLLERMDLPGTPDLPLYSLAALAATSYSPDRMTDFLVANIVAQQANDGHWRDPGGVARPPVEDGNIFRTALGIRATKAFGPPGRAGEMAERIDRAQRWLLSARAITAEDRSMQLLGLRWAGADEKVLQRLAKQILAQQRADGGWAQRAELASDAYASGESLYALSAGAGAAANDPSYRKGVKYLLGTQRADGSWYVSSRAPKFQPYFESGFPYGHDQWISSMATGWATIALALAIDEPPAKGRAAE